MLAATDQLVAIGGEEIIDYFISLLQSDNPSLRNCVALGLRDLKANRAIEPLLAAISKPENLNYNGTMVYALQTMDCKDKLVEIFKILFYQGWEAKQMASMILNEQIFEFSRQDLFEIHRMWKNCKQHPETCPCFDHEKTRRLMEANYEGFISYLKEE